MSDSVSKSTKYCKRCNTTKPISDFYPKMSKCKDCSKLYSKSYQRRAAESNVVLDASRKRKCYVCDDTKYVGEFKKDRGRVGGYASICKECHNLREGARTCGYEITVEQYKQMLVAQNGLCAICNKKETVVDAKTNKVRNLAVDHDHATGETRGLLCCYCNTTLAGIESKIADISGFLKYLGYRIE